MTAHNDVFISYSHADEMWLKRLQVHLAPLQREGVISLWDDTRIAPGSQWRVEIREALNRARVAILLVSADFLASEFISTNELPPLLASAQKRGTLILPVIVSPCWFERTPSLACFQAVNAPSEPLVSMRKAKREKVFLKVSSLVEEAFSSTKNQDSSNLPLDHNATLFAGLASPSKDAIMLFIKTSDIGAFGRPSLDFPDFCSHLGIDVKAGRDVIDELEGRGLTAHTSSIGHPILAVQPEDSLFWSYDHVVHAWDPQVDALMIAGKLVDGPANQLVTVKLAEELGWEPRRINPALTFLVKNGIVGCSKMSSYPLAVYSILETAETRRYVRIYRNDPETSDGI